MFEKEAEERAERKISNFIPQQWGVSLIRTEQTYETVEGAPHFYLRSLAKMWKEGAEYGYNKAKIEVEESYKESLCNSELNLASVTEQLEELEKANEWHDLRKNPNDLPKRNNELTDRSDVIITDKGIAHYNFRKQKWYVHNFECDMSFSEGVIAWCEIPKYTEE